MKANKIGLAIVSTPVKVMRYKTAGDWHAPVINTGRVYIAIDVVETRNQDYDFLVGIHELVEAYLCYRRGITDKVVTGFDIEHLDSDDPGSLIDAPYASEHEFATNIEAQMSVELGVDWIKY